MKGGSKTPPYRGRRSLPPDADAVVFAVADEDGAVAIDEHAVGAGEPGFQRVIAVGAVAFLPSPTKTSIVFFAMSR